MSLIDRLRDSWKTFTRVESLPETASASPSERIAELETRCQTLEERLKWCDEHLRERSELLYNLQQHYSSEHFDLQESMRNLNIERMRNAGAYADREIVLTRATDLQARIHALKERLRKHEPVEDLYFDDAPIVRS
jgi:chromosome segregation ATPase